MMVGIHADVSAAAAEVYAASVALNEFLQLWYVTEFPILLTKPWGFEFPIPLTLEVDNQAVIHFSKGSTKRSKMSILTRAKAEWRHYVTTRS